MALEFLFDAAGSELVDYRPEQPPAEGSLGIEPAQLSFDIYATESAKGRSDRWREPTRHGDPTTSGGSDSVGFSTRQSEYLLEGRGSDSSVVQLVWCNSDPEGLVRQRERDATAIDDFASPRGNQSRHPMLLGRFLLPLRPLSDL